MKPVSSTPDQEGQFVQMGDFTFWIERAQMAAVCWHEREIIQRLFVTARDQSWCETPPVEWEARMLAGGEGIALRALHRSPLLEFEWQGHFNAGNNNITFEIEGRCLRDMQICRLGLVVLYPVGPLLSSQLRIEGPAGKQQLQLRRQIYPQRLVGSFPSGMTQPFSSLSIVFKEGGELSCEFGGDLFELEDQRNWADASFKAYCTPLSLGFPRPVARGTVIRQGVRAAFSPKHPETALARNSRCELSRSEMTSESDLCIPSFGICVSDADARAEKLSYPGWSHIQLDLATQQKSSSLTDLIDGLSPGVALELAVTIESDWSVNRSFIDLLNYSHSRIARVLLRGPGGKSPATQRSVAQFCEALKAANTPIPPLLLATDGHFVEMNRGDALSQLDGIAFPFASTVHLSGRWVIAESPGVLMDMVATARNLSRKGTVAISPLALFHPPSPATDQFPDGLQVPWFLAILIEATKSKVSSLTLATDLIAAFESHNSRSILALLRRWSQHGLQPLRFPESPKVYGATIDCGNDETDLILVNLSRIVVEVQWGEQFNIGRISNPSTGVLMDPHEYAGGLVQLLPATALVAQGLPHGSVR